VEILETQHGIHAQGSCVQRYINKLADEKRIILNHERSRNIALPKEIIDEIEMEEKYSPDIVKITLPSIEEFFPSKDMLFSYHQRVTTMSSINHDIHAHDKTETENGYIATILRVSK
jgi:hypothetical protein